MRAFALAGKVVIFDEIHSYDAYTGSLLAELIGSLRNWGCTVILLSATLTSEACRKFAQLKELPSDDCYPRLLVNDHDRISIFHVEPPGTAEVELSMTADEDMVIEKALACARTGEQVLWIENTVPQAQQIFRQFTALAPELEIGLIQSRFPVCIRSTNEDYWTGLLGKNGASERCKNGRILVATQVLEQSVDVDADLLVTRIAPADFLFQRIGRLWRHSNLNGVRPSTSRRQTIILAPEYLADPETVEKEKRSFLPYDAYWIRRTWEVLQGKSKLEIPADIRPVLEEIYREREEESDSLKHLKTDVADKNEKLQLYANVASAKIGDMQNDETFAATRFSEEDQVQLLLLRKGNLGEKCNRRIHPFFDSAPIDIPASDAPRKERVAAARKILPMMLKIPARHAPAWEDFPADFLRGIMWTGDDSFHPVRAAYIDEAGRILDQSCNVVSKNGLQFAYHEKQGYIYRKIEEGN